MSKVIDKDEVLALLKRAVEAKGADYIDPASSREFEWRPGEGCSYTDGTGPSCIVGHVFDYAGIDVTNVENGGVKDEVLVNLVWTGDEYEERIDFPTYRFDSSYLDGADVEAPDYEFTTDAVEALAVAQARQDAGNTWGEAYEAALEAL